MKISIVTVTYNSAQTLPDTIRSVLSQTYSDVEYIVVDGKSSDGTLDIIKEYEPLFKNKLKWISEKDNGIYDAINKGISFVKDDVILGVLHSDDIFASAKILTMVEQTFLKTNADVVYGDLAYVDKINPDQIVRYWKSQQYGAKLLGRGWMPPHPTVFVKKSVYEKIGVFDSNFKISADYDLMLRIFRDESLKKIYIPEIITKMRIGGASNKNIRNLLRKSFEDYLILKKNKFKHPVPILLLKNISKISQFFSQVSE